MSERRQIFTLVTISLVLGVAGLIVVEYLPRVFRDDSAYVERYRATLYPEGRLEEEFTYRLNEGGLRMLFRVWRARARERYPPGDIGMWEEWLVYGTALGVGDAVVRALRVLDTDLPEARYMRAMPVYFHPFVVASTSRGLP